jgi:GNAT superfamily N-acetyltransferase
MVRFDDSLVMAIAALDGFGDEYGDLRDGGVRLKEAVTYEAVDPTMFAESIGAARGSPARERATHADRLANAPVPHHAIVVRDARGVVVAGGQIAVEAPLVGLYDIFTIADHRRRGHGERVCRRLLGQARRSGATAAYLQVDAGNDVARRLYDRLGFRDAYPYHYRAAAAAAR